MSNGSKTPGPTVWGRALSLVGLLFCAPVGALFVSVATEAVGLFLGVVGYVLGARRLGVVTVLACTAAMFLGLLVAQGMIPGSYDRAVDGFFRDIHSILGNLR
jgi:hypothetical protein